MSLPCRNTNRTPGADAAELATLKQQKAESDTTLQRLRELAPEIIRMLRCVRVLDCGAHYCRYCPARSPAWEHDPSCPYVESQKEYDRARTAADELASILGEQTGEQP